MKIDPIAGDEADFSALCHDAAARGMALVLDGVFNHTGSDSRYFNDKARYPGVGAAQSKDSPYYSWYTFRHWPDDYECWWGVPTLPQANEADQGYRDFILGREGVLRHWLRAGASGYRLDVADELPDSFLAELRQAVKEENPGAVIVGEVWEDASNKISYGQRRHYLEGKQLDGVTNYPAKDAILQFVQGTINGPQFADRLMALHENYPPPARRCLMNIVGTHDTARILNVLACDASVLELNKQQKSVYLLNAVERSRGVKLLKLASALQYLLPGAPCLYYGDEAGLEGFEDPLNRRCYPWGAEDAELLQWYRELGKIRKVYKTVLTQGELTVTGHGKLVTVTRTLGTVVLAASVNASDRAAELALDAKAEVLLGSSTNQSGKLVLPPRSVILLKVGIDDA